MTVRWHLANFNVARMRAAHVEDPLMEGFTSNLDRVNAVADATPGFVWRLQTDEGHATAIRAYDDERILLNLSVWESVDALRDYVYASAHGEMVRNGREWFEPLDESSLVLWWIPAGTLPTLEVAREKLAAVRTEGPSPDAFTFRTAFPPPES